MARDDRRFPPSVVLLRTCCFASLSAAAECSSGRLRLIDRLEVDQTNPALLLDYRTDTRTVHFRHHRHRSPLMVREDPSRSRLS
uniref:Putative secreted protein n=1 Tax=Anopheles marajoara TaxID=58244 RepID=A0A2M4CB11_9DIPT